MIEIVTGVAAFFRIDAVAEDGTVRELAPWQQNHVLNTGMDILGSGSTTMMEYCSVGTGSTAPADTQTALVARVATVSRTGANTYGASGSVPYYGWLRGVFDFPAGTATGNIAEIGLSNSAGSTCYTRALIRDAGGTVTTVTVLSTESLRVTYEARVYVSTADATFTQTVKGTSTTFTLRPFDVNGASSMAQAASRAFQATAINLPGGFSSASACFAYGGASAVIAAVTATSIGGTYLGTASAISAAAYTNGNYYRDGTVTFGAASANHAQLGVVTIRGTHCDYQVGIVPSINKVAGETMSITFRNSWARVTVP